MFLVVLVNLLRSSQGIILLLLELYSTLAGRPFLEREENETTIEKKCKKITDDDPIWIEEFRLFLFIILTTYHLLSCYDHTGGDEIVL